MNADPASELVEVVARDGSVLDIVPRSEVRARNLWHRCTYVAVVTGAGELVVHQRADWKDVYPSFWDLAFGGIAGVGEPWETAAKRELAEEAGVRSVDLVDLGPVFYDEDDGRVVGRVFVTIYEGTLQFDDGEVVGADRVPIDRIDGWLEGRQVCPDSKLLVLPLVRRHLGG
ncbi:MAG: NUDIX domain-containing protein [Acidimicrobiales bacterium]